MDSSWFSTSYIEWVVFCGIFKLYFSNLASIEWEGDIGWVVILPD